MVMMLTESGADLAESVNNCTNSSNDALWGFSQSRGDRCLV